MDPIGDHRWDGYSLDELADQIREMRGGKGVGSFGEAVAGLAKAADALESMDDALRKELGKLGVAWNSRDASEKAKGMHKDAAEFAALANQHVSESKDGVDRSAEGFSRAKNGMPEPEALKPDLDLSPTGMVKNGVQTVMPHMTSDYTKELRHAGDARQQTIQHLHGYTETSRDSLASYKPLPPPPTNKIKTDEGSDTHDRNDGHVEYRKQQPPDPGQTVISSVGPQPTGGPDGPGNSGPGGVSGPGGGGPTGGGVPTGGGNQPGPPERFTGSGPMPDGGQGGPGGTGAPRAPMNPKWFDAAANAAGLGGVGAGIGGSRARGERAYRMPRGSARATEGGNRATAPKEGSGAAAKGPGAKGTGTKGPAEKGPGGKATGQPEGGGKPGAGGNASAKPGARGEVGAAKEAMAGENAAGKGRQPLMQPATGKGKKGEDAEHVRKYGIEGDDVFNDVERVAPPVIGELPEEDQRGRT